MPLDRSLWFHQEQHERARSADESQPQGGCVVLGHEVPPWCGHGIGSALHLHVRGTSGAVNDLVETSRLLSDRSREAYANAGWQGAGK